MSARYLSHGAAETTQPCLCSVGFCSGGVEAPALSNPLLCVCTYSAASRKPVRSSASLWDVHAIFPLPHIQDFSPKPYSRTFVNNAVHSSQGKEHREFFFLELFHPGSLGLNDTLPFQQA